MTTMHLLNSQQRISRYSSKNIDIAAVLHEHLKSIYQRYYDPETQRFNYHAFAKSEAFQTYQLMLSGLHNFNITQLKNDDKKVSFWLNIYNMLCIHLVIKLKVTDSVEQHNGFFSQYCYLIDGREFTLDDIEHGILRANSKAYSKLQKPFKKNDLRLALACQKVDPKIHFGLYSASSSSPKLKLFEADKIQQKLKENTEQYIKNNMRFNFEKGVIYLPKVFKWYEHDFGDKNRIIEFIAKNINDEYIESNLLTYKNNLRWEFLDFKWELNKA